MIKIATIGDLWVKLNGDTSHFEKGMSNATNSANSFGGMMQGVSKMVAGFLVYDVGKKLVSGFVSATKAGIVYNATMEQSAIKWETLLGTQEKAIKMLNDIEKFAATTPFEKMGVEAMATQLHNAGFRGQELFDQLSKFGDLSGAFGIQADSLKEMVRQYAQVKQAGVAYTEDLNILQDRGIPIYKALAEELGINTSDVKKWASEGKISADIYQSALDNLASGVEGGMAKMSKSFNGQMSTLKDNFSQMSGILSQPIFDFLSQQLSNVLPIVEKITASLSENGLMGTIQRFAPGIMPFVQLAMGIFETMGSTVQGVISSMTSFWNEHSSWLMPLITFVWSFICSFISNTINAIGQVIQSGLAIIDGIINFFQNLFSGNFQGCWESIKQIFTNAINLIWNWMQVQFAVNIPNMIKNFGKSIPNIMKSMWESIKNFFSQGITSCIQFVVNLFSNASNSFNMLRTFGANAFQALWSVAKTMMSNLLSSVTSYITQVPTVIRNFMTQAVNVIKNINLVQVGKDMIQGLINGISGMASKVVGAVTGVVKGAVDGAKKLLGIKSPSRVFRQIGDDTGQGLVLGIEGKEDSVLKASTGLSSAVMSGYNASIETNFNKTSKSTQVSKDGRVSSEKTPIIELNIDGRTFMRTIAKYKDELNNYDGRNAKLSYR